MLVVSSLGLILTVLLSIPYQSNLFYEDGSRLEDKIREMKTKLSDKLTKDGCLEVRLEVSRNGETIFIKAICQQWRDYEKAPNF